MPARDISPSACGRNATCQLRRPTPSQRRVSHAAQACLRSLSLGRGRITQACCVRAPCRAGYGRATLYRRAPRRREASLLRHAAVVRRASCGLQRQASAACLARRRRTCTLCLSGGGAARKLAAHARCAALDMVGLRPTKGHRVGERHLSFGARHAVVRRASCGVQCRVSAACLVRRRRAYARCL